MLMRYDCVSTVCVFMHTWACCSRSLKTHLRHYLTHVPSSSDISNHCADRLMPGLQLLRLHPKPLQTGAITPHCPPPLPALLNSHMSLVKERPQREDAELTKSSFTLCLPHSVLLLSHTLAHMQRGFACVPARVQQDWSISNALSRLLFKGLWLWVCSHQCYLLLFFSLRNAVA